MFVCVYVFVKLHITAQSGSVIYSFYTTVCNPPGGKVSEVYSWLEMRVHTATTHLPTTTALGRNPTPSTPTTTLCLEKNMDCVCVCVHLKALRVWLVIDMNERRPRTQSKLFASIGSSARGEDRWA